MLFTTTFSLMHCGNIKNKNKLKCLNKIQNINDSIDKSDYFAIPFYKAIVWLISFRQREWRTSRKSNLFSPWTSVSGSFACGWQHRTQHLPPPTTHAQCCWPAGTYWCPARHKRSSRTFPYSRRGWSFWRMGTRAWTVWSVNIIVLFHLNKQLPIFVNIGFVFHNHQMHWQKLFLFFTKLMFFSILRIKKLLYTLY